MPTGNETRARPFRLEAHACRIYGMLKIAPKEGYTAAELSEILNIRKNTISAIADARGWPLRDDRGRHDKDRSKTVEELKF